ncbi:MAG: glycosyltransferase family 8 protein [Bacteroidota bacterium]
MVFLIVLKKTLLHISFNIDRTGLQGLGATVNSLLANCSQPETLYFHFLCSNLPSRYKQAITELLKELGFSGEFRFWDFDAEVEFAGLPAFHNNYTVYGRLLIPKLIDADQVLYLDTDLIVTVDVLLFQKIALGNYLIGAISRGTIANSLDKEFFINQGIPTDTPYFNAGVLLINVKRWRQQQIERSWRELAFQNSTQLTAHDQTILNAICNGSFYKFGVELNTPLMGNMRVDDNATGIFHFIGSPKPWDFLGRYLHNGYWIWKSYSLRSWQQHFKLFSIIGMSRSWNIRRSLVKSILQHFQPQF